MKQVVDGSTWLSVQAVHRYTGYAPDTIRRAAGAGQLRGHQRGANCTWRFRVTDVDAWLRGETPVGRRRTLRTAPSPRKESP